MSRLSTCFPPSEADSFRSSILGVQAFRSLVRPADSRLSTLGLRGVRLFGGLGNQESTRKTVPAASRNTRDTGTCQYFQRASNYAGKMRRITDLLFSWFRICGK